LATTGAGVIVAGEAAARGLVAGRATTSALRRRLLEMLPAGERPRGERERLAALIELLATLPPPPDRHGLFPDYPALRSHLATVIDAGDIDALEGAFLELYCHLHGHVAPYEAAERQLVDSTGGYWCHAGGISPVLKAPDWLAPASRSIDFGAGNGLQLLLVQWLSPHALTVQVEISSRMCEAGRDLQRWLGIAGKRVEWRVADATAQSPAGFDLVYLYRPVRPEGAGRDFYRRFAADLAASPVSPVVLSVADCLREFLPQQFERFYFDGHLACYRRAG
jgi:hypothetical protein